MLNRLNAMAPGAKMMLTAFLFTAVFGAFHLVKGVTTLHIHLIIGGNVSTAASVLMILICWHCGSRDDQDERTEDCGK